VTGIDDRRSTRTIFASGDGAARDAGARMRTGMTRMCSEVDVIRPDSDAAVETIRHRPAQIHPAPRRCHSRRSGHAAGRVLCKPHMTIYTRHRGRHDVSYPRLRPAAALPPRGALPAVQCACVRTRCVRCRSAAKHGEGLGRARGFVCAGASERATAFPSSLEAGRWWLREATRRYVPVEARRVCPQTSVRGGYLTRRLPCVSTLSFSITKVLPQPG
jgi:hypothetical protein